MPTIASQPTNDLITNSCRLLAVTFRHVQNCEFRFSVKNAKFSDFISFPSKTILFSPQWCIDSKYIPFHIVTMQCLRVCRIIIIMFIKAVSCTYIVHAEVTEVIYVAYSWLCHLCLCDYAKYSSLLHSMTIHYGCSINLIIIKHKTICNITELCKLYTNTKFWQKSS